MLSDSVRWLRFATASGAPFQYLAGQYVELIVPTTGLAVKRDYSLASAFNSARPDVIEVAVTRVAGGRASDSLHMMPVGTELEGVGPRGGFTFRARPDVPVLFVAHGAGLAPLRAMLGEASAAAPRPRTTLLFGGRTERDLLWAEELRALAAVPSAAFRFEPTLSRASAAWRGRSGRVQAHLEALLPADRAVHVYACGLRGMTDDVVRVARGLGVASDALFTEEYD